MTRGVSFFSFREPVCFLRYRENTPFQFFEFFKGPYLDIGRERHRRAERVYDAAVQGYLLTGSVDEKLQREMIADAARRIKPTQPVTPDRVFDFSFVQKVVETLR